MFGMSVKKQLSLTAAGLAAAGIAGCVVGLSTSAQADSPVCGQAKANVIGTYTGGDTGDDSVSSLKLNADNTATFNYHAPRSTTWKFQDSSIIVASPGLGSPSLHLLPQCAGAKVKPENLIGMGDNGAAFIFNRNA